MSLLHAVLAEVVGGERATELRATFAVPPGLVTPSGGELRRATIATALHLLLAGDLLQRVPSAGEYVAARRAAGEQILLDHGAVRTVLGVDTGALPRGEESVARLLRPLGYAHRETYDLAALRMTGRSWTHRDHPEEVPQFFLSELHVDRFDVGVRAVAQRVLSTSRDPLGDEARGDLDTLERTGSLAVDRVPRLLSALVTCFDRQHEDPGLDDYEELLPASAEMAWIATEGNAFNHATDRVPDVVALAEAERMAGRPIKDTVEVSESGRVLQTAHRAATVTRRFRAAQGEPVDRDVPGSFWEFITRKALPDGGLDLSFDAANAQGIFTMTRAC